jgi:hypothetical protein
MGCLKGVGWGRGTLDGLWAPRLACSHPLPTSWLYVSRRRGLPRPGRAALQLEPQLVDFLAELRDLVPQ